MSEMVERVAKAICGAHGWNPKYPSSDDFKAARAAIQAMRDVDSGAPNLLRAGKGALYSCSEDPEIEDARRCWHAIIDEALKP